MSSEVLRRAARLMRERAEAATCGPWKTYVDPNDDPIVFDQYGTGVQSDGSHDVVCYSGQLYSRDAEHIASWDHDVALAVADWLDNAADRQDHADGPRPEFAHAENIATAYLGESS